jgi:predicted RNA-binding protein YlxR (DUF448 family)
MPKVRKIPQRQCVACGQMRAKRDLVRVVRTPSGGVQVDLTGKLSGRGAYVCRDPDCVDRALRDRRLAGALDVTVPDDVGVHLKEAASRPPVPHGPVVRRISLARQAQQRAEG